MRRHTYTKHSEHLHASLTDTERTQYRKSQGSTHVNTPDGGRIYCVTSPSIYTYYTIYLIYTKQIGDILQSLRDGENQHGLRHFDRNKL